MIADSAISRRWLVGGRAKGAFVRPPTITIVLTPESPWGQDTVIVGVEPQHEESTAYNLSVAVAHTFFVAGSEGGDGVWVHNGDPEFLDYEQARNAAVRWLDGRGFVAEQPVVGKFGSQAGSPIGMKNADGTVGYRVEFDARSGAHINTWDWNAPGGPEKGPHFTFEGSKRTVERITRRFRCR